MYVAKSHRTLNYCQIKKNYCQIIKLFTSQLSLTKFLQLLNDSTRISDNIKLLLLRAALFRFVQLEIRLNRKYIPYERRSLTPLLADQTMHTQRALRRLSETRLAKASTRRTLAVNCSELYRRGLKPR